VALRLAYSADRAGTTGRRSRSRSHRGPTRHELTPQVTDVQRPIQSSCDSAGQAICGLMNFRQDILTPTLG